MNENENAYTVFICEDDELAREIAREQLGEGKITYMNMLPAQTDRDALIASIETFEK